MTDLPTPIVSIEAVTKTFGATVALKDVDFQCFPGEVHAILGENGAGKSTLMKTISGVIRPTSGVLRAGGTPVTFKGPGDALRAGFVCMYQELSLVPDLSVQENLLLGAPGSRLGRLDRSPLATARDLLDRIDGQDIRLGAKVSDLTLAECQQVEIVKALIRKPKLLILDEATSALNASVVEKVFDLIRAQRDEGVAVLFISHRFHEIEALADRISVFRNGQRVETFPNGAHDYAAIIDMMVGQRIDELFPAKRSLPQDAKTVLDVADFAWQPEVKPTSFTVKAGQIVGLGGLDGQGQSRLLQGLFGLLRGTEGTLRINGAPIPTTGPKAAKQANIGLAYIPEDRKADGLIQDQSIMENLDLAAMGRADLAAGDVALYAGSLDRLELKHGGLDLPVSSLSGGNQQKVVLAKWLALAPKVLLLADPTRGIDVKTKTQIYTLLRELADAGTAILLLSTDYEELIHLCDETHIFYDGAVTRSLSGDDLSAQNIIAASLNIPSDGGVAHA
ncbi:ribose import ATP-binding protein RbsA [Jannaschia pagri]|uniref:Ribose import ATP-binding protein RbsA n=1 Tax=Jannaschia pagri TaxID=2829797 RepID=A0ABQ4NIM9_9RHOB|nr:MULTISPECIES: sugar ABC transporter ATP-binding protein [unclassified Jannaschia]GIT89623.1 ribose import ATP-binding protein RbsA [Jannaschia sp. AI_61]GIT94269.1 ribose import ATP-binding protein RbsA [Jannaschia sp. AI_62]